MDSATIPDDPTSTTPVLPGNGGSIAAFFHGNQTEGADITIDFSLGTTFTATVLESRFVVDMWGRDGSDNAVLYDRDDDIMVVILKELLQLLFQPPLKILALAFLA